MINKIDFSEILTIVVPGGTSIIAIRYIFPETINCIKIQDQLILSFAFIFFSLIAGHLLNAVKSSTTWKNIFEGENRNPSDHVFDQGLGRTVLSKEYANKIKDKIVDYKFQNFKSENINLDVWNAAQQISCLTPSDKLIKLHEQYQFYRVMNVSIVFIVFVYIIRLIFKFSYLDLLTFNILTASLFVCFTLFKNMARSRARYFVRELLFITEGHLDAIKKETKAI